MLRVSCRVCSYEFYCRPGVDGQAPGLWPVSEAPAPSQHTPAVLAPVRTEPVKGDWGRAEKLTAWTSGLGLLLWLLAPLQVFAFIIAYFAGFGLGMLAHVPAYKYRMWRYKHQACLHGIRGGYVLRRCAACRKAREAEEEDAARRQAAAEQQARLANEAKALREAEIKRLKHSLSLSIDDLLRLTPYQFEDRIADLYRRLGYTVEQTPYSGDRGRDAIIRLNGATYLVECKLFSPQRPVGRRDLQIFFAAITEENADGGYFVTTGRVTAAALEYVSDKGIEFVDRPALIRLLHQAYPDGTDDSYRALCATCGRYNYLKLRESDARNCSCGEELPTIGMSDILKQSVRNSTKSSFRRTRRRRGW